MTRAVRFAVPAISPGGTDSGRLAEWLLHLALLGATLAMLTVAWRAAGVGLARSAAPEFTLPEVVVTAPRPTR